MPPLFTLFLGGATRQRTMQTGARLFSSCRCCAVMLSDVAAQHLELNRTR